MEPNEIYTISIKDKKARKQIKELKEEIKEMATMLAVVKTILINNHLVSELGFDAACEFVKKKSSKVKSRKP